MRVREMREQEIRNRQSNLKCRYFLNKTLQRQQMSQTEKKKTPRITKVHTPIPPVMEIDKIGQNEQNAYLLSQGEMKRITKNERFLKVIDQEYSDGVKHLRKQFDFYKPHDRVRQRLEKERQTSSFLLSGGTVEQKEEKPDLELKPLASHEVIHIELSRQRLEVCQNRTQRISKNTSNEYLDVDQSTFEERVNQNKVKLRAKLKDLTRAKRVYLDLLNVNNANS